MLLNDLSHLGQLDDEILSLQQHLSKLYNQRRQLVSGEPRVANTADGQQDYRSIAALWRQYGVEFPAGRNMRQGYNKACRLAAQLERNYPELTDALYVVAVPPAARLEKAVRQTTAYTAGRYGFIDSTLWRQCRRSGKWQWLVVAEPSFAQPVYGLSQYIAEKQYLCDGHDVRGLGARELLAADMQGVSLLCDADSTLLLKEGISGGVAVCAYTANGTIVLDEEDSDCLIGDNLMPVVIEAK